MRIQRLLSQLKCWRVNSPGISNGTAHHHHHPNDTKCAWALVQNLQAMTLTEEHGPPTVPFHELMDVLRETTTLERLQVERSFVECLSVTEQFMFWRVLSQNIHIQCLSLAEFTEEHPLATSVLVTLFQGQKKESARIMEGQDQDSSSSGGGGIIELDLSHVRLTGNLDSLRHAVKGWTSLERIQLWDVNGLEQQPQQHPPGNDNNNNNTPNSIRQQDILELLLEIPKLQELVLGDGFSFDIPQIDAICTALSQPHNRLKSLRLMGGCSHNQNHNSHDDPFYQQAAPLAFESAIALAQMLQVNQSLTSLELSNLQLAKSPQPYCLTAADHGNETTTSSGLVVLAHALQHANRTLRSLQLFQINLFSRQDLTLEENEALVTMLQDNHVLEYCSASESSGSSHHAQLIQFYLTLNQYNLRNIHVDVNRSRKDMVRLLTETTDGLSNQLDCVYHVLKDNPTLVW